MVYSFYRCLFLEIPHFVRDDVKARSIRNSRSTPQGGGKEALAPSQRVGKGGTAAKGNRPKNKKQKNEEKNFQALTFARKNRTFNELMKKTPHKK